MAKRLTCYPARTMQGYHADACLLLALAVVREAARDRRSYHHLAHSDALRFFRDCQDWVDMVIDLAEAMTTVKRSTLIY